MAFGCNKSNKAGLSDSISSATEKTDTIPTVSQEDTIVHKMPYYTAELEDAINYFRINNKYKDWQVKDSKTIIIQCVVEKDSTSSGIKILRNGSGNKDLDNEAIRLIKEADILPARDDKGKPIRSIFSIAVHFPPK